METNPQTKQKSLRVSDTSPNHPKSIGYRHWRLICIGKRGMNWQIAKNFADEIGVDVKIIFGLTHPCTPENGKTLESMFNQATQ